MAIIKNNGATIPYQLRPRKAIERNIFIDLLKKIGASNKINFEDYRYVGFGAAYLEDFKQMHIELGIVTMDCIEMDKNAFSRQIFNNPYYFVTPYNISSTEYIDQCLNTDKNQIFWLDYTMPKMLKQQLTEIDILCSKLAPFDIVKFTFNSQLASFINSNHIHLSKKDLRYCHESDFKIILQFLKEHPTFNKYLPEDIKVSDIPKFDAIIRAMAVRAVNRGLLNENSGLKFQHLTAFTYADGQEMTTVTGIVCSDEEFAELLEQSKLQIWPFYNNANTGLEFIEAVEITVPDMTVSERIEIDKKIPSQDLVLVANQLAFKYGTNMDEHIRLIKGYHTFYKYLPYFSKVIY